MKARLNARGIFFLGGATVVAIACSSEHDATVVPKLGVLGLGTASASGLGLPDDALDAGLDAGDSGFPSGTCIYDDVECLTAQPPACNGTPTTRECPASQGPLDNQTLPCSQRVQYGSNRCLPYDRAERCEASFSRRDELGHEIEDSEKVRCYIADGNCVVDIRPDCTKHSLADRCELQAKKTVPCTPLGPDPSAIECAKRERRSPTKCRWFPASSRCIGEGLKKRCYVKP